MTTDKDGAAPPAATAPTFGSFFLPGPTAVRHEVLAAHLVDRQKAHQCAAREPDQQLCADEQREPFMCPTGEHMNAVSIALQNQNLIPATKLTAFGFSPANRA